MFVAPMMGMPKMDFGHMLGTGNPMMAMPYVAGWMSHFIVGIVMALVFVAVVRGKLPGNSIVQGMIYAFVMPRMGTDGDSVLDRSGLKLLQGGTDCLHLRRGTST